MSSYVIDLSQWQGNVNMGAIKGAGVIACIAKAQEGGTYQDPQWLNNKAKMLDTFGLGGAYHYMNRGPYSGADQCKYFMDRVPSTFVHALDVEAPGPLDVDGWFKAYRQRYPEKFVWLYTNLAMWTQISKLSASINAPQRWGPVGIWVAGVGNGYYQSGKDDFRAIWGRVPAGSDGGLPYLGFTGYTAMQYTGSATVPGVAGSGNCDMSVIGGDINEMKRYAAVKYAPSTPDTPPEENVDITEQNARDIWTKAKWQEYFDEDKDGTRDNRTPVDMLWATHKATLQHSEDIKTLKDGQASIASKLDQLLAKLGQ